MSVYTDPIEALQTLSAGRWLARGIIPAGGLVRLVGAPGAWKTFLLMKLSVCTANGVPFFGKETEKSIVHYISAEDGADVHSRRIAAEMDTVGKAGNPFFYLHNTSPMIETTRGFQELRARLGLLRLYDLFPIIEKYIPYGSEKHKELWRDVLPLYNSDHLPPGSELTERDLESVDFIAKFYFDEALSYINMDSLTPSERILFDMIPIIESVNHWSAPDNWRESFPESDWFGIVPQLLIIDTYSATSADDEKNTVAAYHRTLRKLQQEYSGFLTIIICDHFTKSGDSYMGSLAKAGDMDAMLFLKKRNGVARLTCEKMRSSIPFAPIDITAQTFDTGLLEKNGEKITTLVLRDGSEKKNLIDTAGSEAAALILELMQESEDGIDRKELQDAFIESRLEENPDQKKDSIRRQFNRHLSRMIKSEVLEESEGLVFLIDD